MICPLCKHDKPHDFKITRTQGQYTAGTTVCQRFGCACVGVQSTADSSPSDQIADIEKIHRMCLDVTGEVRLAMSRKPLPRTAKAELVIKFMENRSFSGVDHDLSKLISIIIGEDVVKSSAVFHSKSLLAVVPLSWYENHDYEIGKVAMFTRDASDMALRISGRALVHGNHLSDMNVARPLNGYCRLATDSEIHEFFREIIGKTDLKDSLLVLCEATTQDGLGYIDFDKYAIKGPTYTWSSIPSGFGSYHLGV